MTMTMKQDIRARNRRRARYSFQLAALSLSLAIVLMIFATASVMTVQGSDEMVMDDPAFSYIPDEEDVDILARLLWGEARGVASEMEQAAVVWCVLNRVDADEWPDTVKGVVTQAYQFAGYSASNPATEDLKEIAADVLTRWAKEKAEGGDVGRVLPADYFYFSGDGTHNYFRTGYYSRTFWDWSLDNPYES